MPTTWILGPFGLDVEAVITEALMRFLHIRAPPLAIMTRGSNVDRIFKYHGIVQVLGTLNPCLAVSHFGAGAPSEPRPGSPDRAWVRAYLSTQSFRQSPSGRPLWQLCAMYLGLTAISLGIPCLCLLYNKLTITI